MKSKYFQVLISILISAIFILGIGLAGCKSVVPAIDQSDKKDEDKDKEKEFSEIIKDCKPITGLFTVYHNDNDGSTYLELLPDNLDKIWLCSITRESGDGTFLDSASLEDAFPFFFKKVNKRIQMIHKNVLFRADRDKPIFRAIEKGVSDSIIASSPILSKPLSSTGAVLVNLNDFFLIDKQNIANYLSEAAKVEFTFDKDDSYFSTLKSFPANTDIEAALHFTSNKPVSSPTSPDARSITLKYYYSISKLPEPGYVPRLADDRLGHFITMYQDYNSVKPETAYVRYVERWRLEKQDPNAELSPPKKPIVYWLEKTIPVEYRDSIKKGILLWNKAFEKVGFKDAIVVYQQPDDADWDPADARYNTIRWMVNPGAGYAVGPDNTDPFTGEIYKAEIRISADMMRFFYTDYEEYINPLRESRNSEFGMRNDEYGITKSAIRNYKYCDYAYGLRQQAAFGWALLESRDFLDGKEKDAEKFVQDYLVDLTVHEVGHTLGLRHNFKASSIRTVEQLNNKEFTSKNGLTGSVMDYAPVNISLEPEKQGEYWNSTIGPYDYWVIEYAYKPFNAKTPEEELPKLKEIADRSSNPDYAYGTDEDCCDNSPRAIDPFCTMFDMSNDLLEYGSIRLKLADELWKKMEEKFTKPGARYQKMRRVFGAGLGEYHSIARLISRYIGGIEHSRDHIGAHNNLPLKPMDAKRQKEALDFLVNKIFSITDASLPPAQLLNKLAPEMLPDFNGSLDKAPSIETQIHNRVLDMQKEVLDYLYNPLVLTRLNDMDVRNENKADKFGIAELFVGLREGIWSELANPENKNIGSFRRNLQREYVDRLINMFKTAPDNIPSDAISFAHNDLKMIQSEISMALSTVGANMDTYTYSHLEDINSRITAALEWKNR